MGEIGARLGADILLDALPVACVQTDTLAPAANGDEAGKGFDLAEQLLQGGDGFFPLGFPIFTFGDVQIHAN